MILNSRHNHSHRSRKGYTRTGYTRTGYTLVELLASLAVLGILVSIGFNSGVEFYQQRRLRSAALEVIAMIQERRAMVAARLTPPANCLSLNPADPSSPINQGMVTTITGLGVRTAAGGAPAPICFTPEGLVLTPMTLVISSPAVARQGDWCVIINPLLAQPHLDWRPNGQSSCRFDAAGGSL